MDCDSHSEDEEGGQCGEASPEEELRGGEQSCRLLPLTALSSQPFLPLMDQRPMAVLCLNLGMNTKNQKSVK